jgi:hypothetical protein
MLWLTIGLGLLVTVGAIYYVARPLFAPARPLQETDDSPLGELVARKDAVLLSIKEIEFDYRTGKLNEADYKRYNHRLRQQAISLIKRIDDLAPDVSDLEAELEAAIADQRQVADAVLASALPPAKLRQSATSAANGSRPSFCHNCGAAIEPDDNFCAACGEKLRVKEMTS